VSFLLLGEEAIASPTTGNTLWSVWTVFTRSAITPPEVNPFGWNLGQSEYIVRRWPWQILDAIGAEARARERAEVLFFCQVSNARFPVSQISRNSHTVRGCVSPWILSKNICENLPVSGLSKKVNFCVKIFNDFRLQAAISVKRLQIAETHDDWRAYGMLAFHMYRWNQLKVIPLACTVRTRRTPCPKKHSSTASCSREEQTQHY